MRTWCRKYARSKVRLVLFILRYPFSSLTSSTQHNTGFYGVTYCIGFRDDFNPSTEQIMKLIYALEARTEPSRARKVIGEIQYAAKRTVHMYIILHPKCNRRFHFCTDALLQNPTLPRYK